MKNEIWKMENKYDIWKWKIKNERWTWKMKKIKNKEWKMTY